MADGVTTCGQERIERSVESALVHQRSGLITQKSLLCHRREIENTVANGDSGPWRTRRRAEDSERQILERKISVVLFGRGDP